MKVRYFRRVLVSDLDKHDFTTAHIHHVPSLPNDPVACIELTDDQAAALAAMERRYESK